MSWECAECHGREGEDRIWIDAVCHHCGKPLCRDDRVLIADAAFAPGPGEAPQETVHCKACKRRYHMTDLRLRSWADD